MLASNKTSSENNRGETLKPGAGSLLEAIESDGDDRCDYQEQSIQEEDACRPPHAARHEEQHSSRQAARWPIGEQKQQQQGYGQWSDGQQGQRSPHNHAHTPAETHVQQDALYSAQWSHQSGS